MLCNKKTQLRHYYHQSSCDELSLSQATKLAHQSLQAQHRAPCLASVRVPWDRVRAVPDQVARPVTPVAALHHPWFLHHCGLLFLRPSSQAAQLILERCDTCSAGALGHCSVDLRE